MILTVDKPISLKLEELQDIESERVDHAKELIMEMAELADANALYQRCFQLLKLGGLEAEIPRLVVFGQQSMGKTTLLDYIMGGPIGYSSTDTGTTQPVVIMLKPTEPGTKNAVECVLRNKQLNIKDLQDAMKTIMTQTHTILSEELELEISVPGGVHAVFVDLPGIKDDSKEGAELTRNVVRSYVRHNPNDLYILVKKASDDPANWPWSLREFILSSPPKGLGLTPRQTMVVGTRAKDFLANEKNDVRSQKQLLDRVKKRAVRGPSGEPLPLYLLELFSLSIEEKDHFDFPAKKSAMQQQIISGKKECQNLLIHNFTASSADVESVLLDFFNVEKFKKDLNTKFQLLLNDQLLSLERRLVRKRFITQKKLADLEEQLAEQNPQSIREYIKLFLRELLQVITELVTGNYMIIRLPDNGDKFLNMFGGNLMDNLSDGHLLALELFPQKDLYDPEFLSRITTSAEEMLKHAELQQVAARALAFPINLSIVHRVNDEPVPDISGHIQPGQYVRFLVTKDHTQMLGHIHSMVAQEEENTVPNSAQVAFYFVPQDETAKEQSQLKLLEIQRITVVIPLSSVIQPNCIPPAHFRCWRRFTRPDNWIGLTPISFKHIQFEPASIAGDGMAMRGTVSYIPLTLSEGNLMGDVMEERYVACCTINDIFCDNNSVCTGKEHIFENSLERSKMTPLQKIAGEFAETKLLNQLSLTHLGRWLKFHISKLEPDRRFSNHVLLQLMRSVKHVVDKADWEPLVADLLQANVRGGLLHLARLAACSTAVALRRILKAGIHEIQRQIQCGDLTSGLLFLNNNARFTEEVEQALELFCRNRAMACANTMRDLIFEQTHAIHFEMIEDFFDGCRQFERDFLNSSLMDDVTRRVREGLAARKQRLGVADIYARRAASVSHNMIYEEVRTQFWVVKMLLAAPLTTKLYMYFVKDIKDRSQHLASESHFSSSESDLERTLQEVLLCEQSGSANCRPIPRSDTNLIEYFDLELNKNELLERIHALKRTEAYVKWALDGVSKLRSQIHKQGGVDFLTRLNLTIEDT